MARTPPCPGNEWPAGRPFVHPKSANGVLVQLAQSAPDASWGGEDQTLDLLLAGRGLNGNGVPSP